MNPLESPRLTAGLLAAIALLSAVAPLSTDMYLPAFPEVRASLGASASQVQLTLTAFMIGMGIGQLFWGPLSDRFGRRRPLIIAGVLLVVVSIVAPFSPNVEILIVARVLQGFAGSAGPVIGRALARDLARGLALAKAMSLLAIVGGIAPAIAPVIGGLLVGPIGWRGVLGVLTVFALAMLACSMFVIPESLPRSERRASSLRAIGVSIRTVLGDRPFLGLALTQMFAFGVLFAFVSASSFVIQTEYELTSRTYSLLFGANALCAMTGGVINSRLVGRLGSAKVLRIGVVTITTAAVTAAVVTAILGQPPIAVLMLLVMSTTLCIAPIMANTSTLGLERHGANAGLAAAVLGAMMFAFGGVVSPLVAVTGAASAVSMTVVMASSAILAILSYALLARKADQRDDAGSL